MKSSILLSTTSETFHHETGTIILVYMIVFLVALLNIACKTFKNNYTFAAKKCSIFDALDALEHNIKTSQV